MANADPTEAEGLQPTRPSTPEANKKPAAAHDTMFSFGSEDDALFADINLECYNDLPCVFIFPIESHSRDHHLNISSSFSLRDAPVLTPGDEPSILLEIDDTTLVEEPAPPIVVAKAESSKPQFSKGVQRQASGSNDAAIQAARTVRLEPSSRSRFGVQLTFP